MPSRKPPTTGEAIAQARMSIAGARVNDPDEHFPYKIGVVERLVSANSPMGPGGKNDASVQVEDVMTKRIAEASADYIDAQAAYLLNPESSTMRELFEVAKDELVAARRAHRRSRVDADGNPVGAIIGLTTAVAPDHQRGPRMRRVGED